jgi:glycosyl transferase family 25
MLLKAVKLVLLISLTLILVLPVGCFVFDSVELKGDVNDVGVKKNSIGVYVINLETSKERYEYIKDNIKSLGFPQIRIDAVDGRKMSKEEIDAKVDVKTYKSFLSRLPNGGTIGCYLSHVKVWEEFLKSGFEFAVVFEDDISFDPGRVKLVIGDLIETPSFWDIVSLEQRHNGLPLIIKKLKNDQELVVYLAEVTHSGAYIINRRAAYNLLKKAFPMRMPLDHYFTRAWEFDLKFTGVENPRLVKQTFGESDIGKTEAISEENRTVFDKLKRGMYKFQSYIIRFLYNCKIYIQAILHHI